MFAKALFALTALAAVSVVVDGAPIHGEGRAVLHKRSVPKVKRNPAIGACRPVQSSPASLSSGNVTSSVNSYINTVDSTDVTSSATNATTIASADTLSTSPYVDVNANKLAVYDQGDSSQTSDSDVQAQPVSSQQAPQQSSEQAYQQPSAQPSQENDWTPPLSTSVYQPPATTASSSGGTIYTGVATYYEQMGQAGSCGDYRSDSDMIVALPYAHVDGGSHCRKAVSITNTNTGKTITAMVADTCPGCKTSDSLDLSVAAFSALCNLQDGTFPMTWSFL